MNGPADCLLLVIGRQRWSLGGSSQKKGRVVLTASSSGPLFNFVINKLRILVTAIRQARREGKLGRLLALFLRTVAALAVIFFRDIIPALFALALARLKVHRPKITKPDFAQAARSQAGNVGVVEFPTDASRPPARLGGGGLNASGDIIKPLQIRPT
jgi:hypothetical protein